jgi:hypothetical protein
MTFNISDKIYDFLRKITHNEYAGKLIYGFPNEELSDNININYIGLEGGMITYLSETRRLIDKNTNPFSSRLRQSQKPGSFLMSILKNPSPKLVEEFVNFVKALSANPNTYQFKEFTGDKISHYYNWKSYIPSNGSLNNSCMKSDLCSDYFGIYTKNPDKVSMLALIESETGLLAGRAILWTLPDGRKLCDRIYGFDDNLVLPIYLKYLNERGWIYKSKQSYSDFSYIQSGKSFREYISIKLDSLDFEKHPYMDTFKWLDVKTGELFNYKPEDLKNVITINSDSGGFNDANYIGFDDISENWAYSSSLTYLEYCGITTNKSNCNYSYVYKSYILKKDALYNTELGDYIFIDDNLNNKDLIDKTLLGKVEKIKSMKAKSDWGYLDYSNNIYESYYTNPIVTRRSSTTRSSMRNFRPYVDPVNSTGESSQPTEQPTENI